MTKSKLKQRLKRITASSRIEISSPVRTMRRDYNYVEMEIDESIEYDDFFEFEKDLLEMKPSRELIKEAPNSHDFEIKPEPPTPFMVLEQKPKKKAVISFEREPDEKLLESDSDVKKDYTFTVGFEFVQCSAIKKNGERCKRQAPKGADICSVHKKILKRKETFQEPDNEEA